MNTKLLQLSSLLLLFVSCSEDITTDIDGSTTLDEVVDYSCFMAEISDSFQERTISTKASLSDHIGFASSATPDLSVMFDDGTSVVYDYDIESEYYNATSATSATAQYIYSTNSDVSGAIVAASFPMEFSAQTAIELKNRKSRVNISYKFDTTADATINAITVNNIYIGKVYNTGYFDTTDELTYRVDTGVAPSDLYTEQVVTDSNVLGETEVADNFQTASYEAFVIPQNLEAYSTYVKFDLTINGESDTYTYYLPDTIYIEPLTLYKMVFEIRYVDDALSFDLTSQSEVAEWEEGEDLSITVTPYLPVWSVWDGSSTEIFSNGSGVDGDPYLIESANQLAYLSKMSKSGSSYTEAMAAHYKLTTNIDWNGSSWTPIGSSSYPFTGVFDGDGYIIKSASNSVDSNNNGLFCYVGTTSATVAAEIKNVTLSNCIFTIATTTATTYKQAGAIAGFVAEGTDILHRIENCTVKNCTVSSSYYVGGIVGSGACDIVGCRVENTTITGYGTNSGVSGVSSIVGLIASNKAVSISNNLSTSNTITAEKSASMSGIIGYLSVATVTNLDVSSNYLHNLTYTANDGGTIYAITSPSSGGNLPTRTNSYHNMVMEGEVNDYDYYTDAVGLALADLLNGGSDPTLEEGDLYWIVEDGSDIPTPAYYSNEE